MNEALDRGGRALAQAIAQAYERGADDYHMEPLVVVDAAGQPVGKVRDGDTVIFCCAAESARSS